MLEDALGLIETKGLVGAIVATDAAAKAASVFISSAEITDASLVTIKIEGELGAVQAAVEAGAYAAEQISELVAVHVIPRPDRELVKIVPPRRYVSKFHPDDNRPPYGDENSEPDLPTRRPTSPSGPSGNSGGTNNRRHTSEEKPAIKKKSVDVKAPQSPDDLQSMSVPKLRQLARTLKDLPLKGRQISLANKETLIEAIKNLYGWS